MNPVQEAFDIDAATVDADEETQQGKAFYFLVKYDTENGSWEIDDDNIYLPEVPLFDHSMQRFRMIRSDEIDEDTELRKQLRATLEGITDATP